MTTFRSNALTLATTAWWIFRALIIIAFCVGWMAVAQTVPTIAQGGERLYAPVYRFNSVQSLATSQVGTDTSCTFVYSQDSAAVCGYSANTFALGKNTMYQNQYTETHTTNSYGPGWNYGNDGGWRNIKASLFVTTFAQRGIHQQLSLSGQTHAVGDNGLIYGYGFTDGGISGQSDEGGTIATLQGGENPGYFHGIFAGGTSTQPALTFTSGNNWTTDGAFLLDITKGTIAGTFGYYTQTPLVAPYGGQSGYLQYLPITLPGGVLLPITSSLCFVNPAQGADHAIPNPKSSGVGVSVTLSCSVQQIGGIAHPMTVGPACVAGNEFPEQAPITSVQAPSAGVQSITVTVRNPAILAAIFQGGVCGQYISFDANLATTGYRSAYYAFGSLTGSDLIYGNNIGGFLGRRGIPDQGGAEAANPASGLNGFHLYPGAEIAFNRSTAATPTLEPNAVPWTVGDVVENPHFHTIGGSGLWVAHFQQSPTNSYFGGQALRVDLNGSGVAGPYKGIAVYNNQPQSLYRSGGGVLSAPHLFVGAGFYGDLFDFDHGPDYSSDGHNAVISIAHTAKGIGGVMTLYDLPSAVSGGVEAPHNSTIGWNVDSHQLVMEGLQMGPLKAITGTRFLCIDQYGNVASSVTPCSGS